MKRALLMLVGGNAVSKLTAVGREMVFAALFGTTNTAAAYRVSQTAFLLPTHALVGDTLSAGILPLYKRLRNDSAESAQALISVTFIFCLIISVIISAVLYSISLPLTNFMAPGLKGEALGMSVMMVQIMAFATPFYIIGNFLGYIEAAHGKYSAISARPTIINIVAVMGALAAWKWRDPAWLAGATVLGYVGFFAITIYQLISLKVLDFSLKVPVNLYGRCAKLIWKYNAPLLTLPLISQGNVLVERIVSSYLGTSVIPGLDYARFITETVTTMTAVPLSIIAMSTHGGAVSKASEENLRRVTTALLIFSCPLSVFLAVNAEEIVQLLFARGAFDWKSVEVTSSIVRGGAIGLVFTVTGYFLIKGLNAQLRNREAMWITAFAVLANVVFDLAFWRQLGPITLGYGASIYGFSIFVLSLSRLKMWHSQMAVIGCLMLGAALSVAVSLVVPPFDGVLISFLLSCVVFSIIWAGTFFFFPPLRAEVAVILKIVRRRRKEND